MKYHVIMLLTYIYVPVLSVIFPSAVLLPNDIPELLLIKVNVKSNVSNPSTTSFHITDILPLPSVAPALILIVNELESKSTPDPMTTL